MSRIAVIGAGIVGLATAYELSNRGFEVDIYEAEGQSGQGTSKANGAQLSYSFVTPLANPSVLRSLPKLLLDRQGALQFHPRMQVSQLRWLAAFIASCTHRKSSQGARDLFQLGQISQQILDDALKKDELSFQHQRSGKLQVFQSHESLQQAHAEQSKLLAHYGVEQHLLNKQETIKLEPSLTAIEHDIQGSLFTPSEECGDCEELCQQLTDLLLDKGFRFHFNTCISDLQIDSHNKVQAITEHGPIQADYIVLATGVNTQKMLRPLKIDPKIYPLRGYSLTFPLGKKSRAPMTSVSDIKNKVVYAPLRDRLRVAGMLDIGVQNENIIKKRLQTLKRQVNEFYPQLNPLEKPMEWTGERAARPDSKPIISGTQFTNLFLNVGHGALGFTLAFGSAYLLANLLCGDVQDPLIQRFRL